jgi:hypothetical protein
MNITLISAAGKSESFQVTERGNDVYALTPVNGLASATAYVLTIPTAVVDLQGRQDIIKRQLNFRLVLMPIFGVMLVCMLG